MNHLSVNPISSLDDNIQIFHEEQMKNELFFIVKIDRSSAKCPSCQQFSLRKHSRYYRYIDDLPFSYLHVHFQILLHKWFCDGPSYEVSVFTQRLSWLDPYKRETNRLEKVLEKLFNR